MWCWDIRGHPFSVPHNNDSDSHSDYRKQHHCRHLRNARLSTRGITGRVRHGHNTPHGLHKAFRNGISLGFCGGSCAARDRTPKCFVHARACSVACVAHGHHELIVELFLACLERARWGLRAACGGGWSRAHRRWENPGRLRAVIEYTARNPVNSSVVYDAVQNNGMPQTRSGIEAKVPRRSRTT